MNSILLSVIVPVFNNEKYLRQCLETIINQSYKYLEIILVDDGSTDGSGTICDDYAKIDTRVQVYHKENQGLIATRKFGVEKSTGEMITFVDSDDWIDLKMYSEMISKTETEFPDIISSGIIYESAITDIEMDIPEDGYYRKNEILDKIIPFMMFDKKFGRRGITSSVCTKIFSKTLLEKYLYGIDNAINYGEDAVITYVAFAIAQSVKVIKQSWYHYRVHSNSMTHIYNEKSFEKIFLLKDELEKKFKKIGIYQIMSKQVEQYVYRYLDLIFKEVYKMNLKLLEYLFPFESVPKDSKIIIYGAGLVGRSYQNCLKNCEYAEVVLWVDKDFYEYNRCGYWEIENPSNIIHVDYDYIVIAIEKEEIALQVRNYLIEQKVLEEKIIWSRPKKIEIVYV